MPLYSSKLKAVYNLSLIFLTLMIIVVSHEFGHVFFGLVAGHKSQVVFLVGSEGLQTYGFATVFQEPLMRNETKFIAMGGIFFNALLAAASFFASKNVRNPNFKDFLIVLAVASALSVVLNALPIPPFDGSFLI